MLISHTKFFKYLIKHDKSNPAIITPSGLHKLDILKQLLWKDRVGMEVFDTITPSHTLLGTGSPAVRQWVIFLPIWIFAKLPRLTGLTRASQYSQLGILGTQI